METFEKIFGIKQSQVHKNCLVVPFIPKDLLKDLGIRKLNKSQRFVTADHKDFTLIKTGIGASLVGDAVLGLKETPCKNIVFFGACGLVQKSDSLNIGSLVVPDQCLAMESFSAILSNLIIQPPVLKPNIPYLDHFLSKNKNHHVHKVKCATFGSLSLEDDYEHFFQKENIDVLDMECSAFFLAARNIKRQAFALMYVTDILKEKPFYSLTKKDQIPIQKSGKMALNLLASFFQSS